MDDDGLNMRNWGYYEPSVKGHLGLQLMSTVVDRNTRPFLTGHESSVMANGPFHGRDSVVSDSQVVQIDYVRETWISQRDKYLNVIPLNHYPGVPDPSGSHTMHMLPPPPEISCDNMLIETEADSEKKDSKPPRKKALSSSSKNPKSKKSRKPPASLKDNGSSSGHFGKHTKKNLDVVINGINMDISGMPIPVCSCTGNPQQCYRWGCGGWQSACCTTNLSMHPLPMSTKRRGARIAGRKMSQGAFKKVLEKLSAEGYSFSIPIDLRTHWAKHGTNKFVTIR